MVSALLLAAALGQGAPAGFKAAFPAATTTESPAGGRLVSASGFEATGLGDTPEAAARAFLRRWGAAFGVTPGQRLVTRGVPAAGQPGPVRFERRIDRRPLFDGDVVVGVDARNAVFLVNGTDVPAEVTGRARISQRTAVRAAKTAIPGLVTRDSPRAVRGWRAVANVVRPVWRVDFIAVKPPGDWRSYVDAETGAVLLRIDLRADLSSGGMAPPKLEPPAPAGRQ